MQSKKKKRKKYERPISDRFNPEYAFKEKIKSNQDKRSKHLFYYSDVDHISYRDLRDIELAKAQTILAQLSDKDRSLDTSQYEEF